MRYWCFTDEVLSCFTHCFTHVELYSCFTHALLMTALLMLYACFTDAVLSCFTHALLMPGFTHALLMLYWWRLYSCFTHALLMRYWCGTLMLYSCSTQLNATKSAFFYFFIFWKKERGGVDSFALKLYSCLTHALLMQLKRLYFTCCFTCSFRYCVLLRGKSS